LKGINRGVSGKKISIFNPPNFRQSPIKTIKMPNYKFKNRRKIKKGKIFNAYFDACRKKTLDQILWEKQLPFGTGYKDVELTTFDYKGKTYAVMSYDHFNGHFSGFSDPASVFGLTISEVI